jgi:hypothetical protein
MAQGKGVRANRQTARSVVTILCECHSLQKVAICACRPPKVHNGTPFGAPDACYVPYRNNNLRG